MVRRRDLDRIFAAGIVWDPREPLPPEFQAANVKPPGYSDRFDSPYPYQIHGDDEDQDIHGPSFDRSQGLGYSSGPYTINFATLNPPINPPSKPGRVSPGRSPSTPADSTISEPNSQGRNVPAFTVQEADRNVLPPLSILVETSVVQDVATVTVTQTFWNDCNIPIRAAAYTFPLPTGCTVTDFTCRLGTNKIIKGHVRPKDEAREAFQKHIRTKHTAAALLEQDTPDVFTTTLGNIPSKTRIKISLSYVTVLKHHFHDMIGVTTLVIPTYIASRYGDEPEDSKIATSSDVPDGLTLRIEIAGSENTSAIACHTHQITVDRRVGKEAANDFADLAGDGEGSKVETALVTLQSGSAFLDKDFVLDITTEHRNDFETPQAWLEEHPTTAGQKALMLTLPPKFFGHRAKSSRKHGEILFLADRSGSMDDKIESLKSAMSFFLKGIPEGHKFNIWSFGSSYSSWHSRSVDYNESNLQAALSYVRARFKANKGGTELLPAIKAMVEARDKKRTTDIIVLTDGQTWRMEQTLGLIEETRVKTEGRVRFFSLGIGDAVSHALVEGIAKAGGGYAEVIPASVREGWEDRVVSMLKVALTTDHLGPIHLEFQHHDKKGNLIGNDASFARRSPADISTISPFRYNRVYFLFDSKDRAGDIDTVTIIAPINSRSNKEVSVPVTRLAKKDTTIHKLAARSILEDLERKGNTDATHERRQPSRRGKRDAIRKEAESIACKWSLVSKWTSFFLVEEPYVPRVKDPFMDNIIEVAESSGDNLLRSRGKLPAHLPLPAHQLCERNMEGTLGSSTPRVGTVISYEPEPATDSQIPIFPFFSAPTWSTSANPPSSARPPPVASHHGVSSIYVEPLGALPSMNANYLVPPPAPPTYPAYYASNDQRATSFYGQSLTTDNTSPEQPVYMYAPYGAHCAPSSVNSSQQFFYPAQPPPPPPTESPQRRISPSSDTREEGRYKSAEPVSVPAPPPRDNGAKDRYRKLEESAQYGKTWERGAALGQKTSRQHYRERGVEEPTFKHQSQSTDVHPTAAEHTARSDYIHDWEVLEVHSGEEEYLAQREDGKARMTVAADPFMSKEKPASGSPGRSEEIPTAEWGYMKSGNSERVEGLKVELDEVIETKMQEERQSRRGEKRGGGSLRLSTLSSDRDDEKAPELERIRSALELKANQEYARRVEEEMMKCRLMEEQCMRKGREDDVPWRLSEERRHAEKEKKFATESMKRSEGFGDRDRYTERPESRREEQVTPVPVVESEVSDYMEAELLEADPEPELLRVDAQELDWRGPHARRTRVAFLEDGDDSVNDRASGCYVSRRRMAGFDDDIDLSLPASEAEEEEMEDAKLISRAHSHKTARASREQKAVQTDFVRQLLCYQRSNGSFDFGSARDGSDEEACLGEDIVSRLPSLGRELKLDRPRLLVAVVIVLLRRDFQSCKSYWDLMESKAVDYLRSRERALGERRGTYKDLLQRLSIALDGVTVPLPGIEASDESSAEEREEKGKGPVTRELVSYAPLE